MCTSKCAKLAPRFCGPFIVIECIGSSTYCLALSDGVEIHPIFHVRCVKELFGSSDNTFTIETLMISEDLASKAHVSKRILNVKLKHLCSKRVRDFKLNGWISL